MHVRTGILIAAVELDVFTKIAAGRRTVSALSKACKASPRGLQAILNELTAEKFLRKSGSKYLLGPEADCFLVRGRPDYLGEYVVRMKFSWQEWKDLAGVVRRGRPRHAVNREATGARFFPKLAEVLFPGNFLIARDVATKLLPGRRRQGWRILDVGCGAAPWSIAFALRDPTTRVSALDLPEVLKVTKRFAARHGVGKQYEYLPGTLQKRDFGRDRYNLILLGHILHSVGARGNRVLIRRCRRALKKGGQLLVIEINPNARRDGPVFPLIFAVNMLMFTDEGDAFPFEEIRSWCREAGFRSVRRFRSASVSPLILARK